MRVPIRWLKDFIEIDLPAKELAYRLTMAGLEAEKIEEIGDGWSDVYVGLVERVERHPNADRLVLAEVAAGEHHLTVVTGAPNIAAGQKVALALAGARLLDTHSDRPQYKTLKPGIIRGIRSEGMVCSEKELGLSDEHEGILVLDPEAPVGVPLAEWLGDTVIDFEITPNLAHAFSILGIAREVAAVTGRPRRPTMLPDEPLPGDTDEALVHIEAPDLCRRYAGVVIDGIEVGPSPAWMTRRLTAAGLRPVNNVVDVTNYVMLEYGQPLHAFDRDRLHQGHVIVRRARPGERIETLDHQQRPLTPEMLVIADADHPVAVAGVMGGVDSEVSSETRTLLLEAAHFDPLSVRRTARALKLRTDASGRFERGMDLWLCSMAAQRAVQLLLELCPGSRAVSQRDVFPDPPQPVQLVMPFDRIERVLGVRHEPAVVLDILSRLEFDPLLEDDADKRLLRVTVPTYRQDVRLPEDIVEDVARIAGYQTLPETLPSGRSVPLQRDPIYRLQQAARATLTSAGCTEAITYVTASEPMLRVLQPAPGDFVGFLHRAPLADLVRLRNPLQAERPFLRPTLVPALQEVLAENLRHETSVRLFELSRVYLPCGRDELPREANVAAVALAGQRDPLSLFSEVGELDFFDLKGVLELLTDRLAVPDPVYRSSSVDSLHPGRAAEIMHGDSCIGIAGELRPDRAAAFGLDQHRICVAELDLDAIHDLVNEAPRTAITVPRFLPVEQDFAIVVGDATPAADVARALRAGAGALAAEIALFDIYRGPQLAQGQKSLAYRVTFTAPDRALTDNELGRVRGRIEQTLRQQVGGTLRT